ncbi:MAG: hypothetical protein H6774_00315 [Pseudomonadales bacterium]|nr:hypothetical protein [Pseudomonadales bacterium]
MIKIRKKNPFTVLYIERNKWQLFKAGQSEPIVIAIPEDISKDLQIQSKATLEKVWAAATKQHKLTPAPVVIVLSEDVLFSQAFSQVVEPNAKEVLDFCSYVPFEDLHTIVIPRHTESTVFVVPVHFLQPILELLRNHGYRLVGVLPESLTGLDFSGHDHNTVVEHVNSMKDELTTFNLVPEISARDIDEDSFYSFKMSPKIWGMIVFFLALVAILFALIIWQKNENEKAGIGVDPSPTPVAQTSTPAPPTPPSDLTQASPIVQATPSATLGTIQVQNIDASQATHTQLVTALEQAGYRIQRVAVTTPVDQATLIVSTSIPEEEVDELIALITKDLSETPELELSRSVPEGSIILQLTTSDAQETSPEGEEVTPADESPAP